MKLDISEAIGKSAIVTVMAAVLLTLTPSTQARVTKIIVDDSAPLARRSV